jgi:hypothetical protein
VTGAALALLAGLANVALIPYAPATPVPAAPLTAARRAQEAAFMRHVRRDQTAEDMTSNVPFHTGDHVAYVCEIEELDRPAVAVGNCGRADEPVDVYLELTPGTWRVGERVRVFGVMDRPASWSDVSGHTIYYPFVKAVLVDRLR